MRLTRGRADIVVIFMTKEEAARLESELTVLLDRFAPTPESMPALTEELELLLVDT